MQKYPLSWPQGWPRTDTWARRRAAFRRGKHDISVMDGVERLLDELRRLGVQEPDIVISTNLKTRLDGFPRSDQPNPQDPGVAVYWQRFVDSGADARKVLAIDHYDTVEGNLGALAATLGAMRAIERHGGARIMERAFTGFTALPAPGKTSGGWRDVFGMAGQEARLTAVEARYKAMRSQYHPDKPDTGDPVMFDVVQKAWQQAQVELGNPA